MELCLNGFEFTIFEDDVFVSSLLSVCNIYDQERLAACCKRFQKIKNNMYSSNATETFSVTIPSRERYQVVLEDGQTKTHIIKKLYLRRFFGCEDIIRTAAESMMHAEAFSNSNHFSILVVETGASKARDIHIRTMFGTPVVEASVYIAKTLYSICVMRWLIGWYNTTLSERGTYIGDSFTINLSSLVDDLKKGWIYTTDPRFLNTFCPKMKARYLNRDGVTVFKPEYVFGEIWKEISGFETTNR